MQRTKPTGRNGLHKVLGGGVFDPVPRTVHIIAASHSASLQRGYRWTASARDNVVAPLTGVAGRLARTLDNFSETFPLFAALAIAVVVAGKSGPLSAWGASLYFGARLVYLPLYAFGVPLVRSLVWNVAALGIILLAGTGA